MHYRERYKGREWFVTCQLENVSVVKQTKQNMACMVQDEPGPGPGPVVWSPISAISCVFLSHLRSILFFFFCLFSVIVSPFTVSRTSCCLSEYFPQHNHGHDHQHIDRVKGERVD